jgi:hypothetical protein
MMVVIPVYLDMRTCRLIYVYHCFGVAFAPFFTSLQGQWWWTHQVHLESLVRPYQSAWNPDSIKRACLRAPLWLAQIRHNNCEFRKVWIIKISKLLPLIQNGGNPVYTNWQKYVWCVCTRHWRFSGKRWVRRLTEKTLPPPAIHLSR